MKKTQFKDSVRNIKKNFVSWLAVSVVTMICCGVFLGSLFYVDDMNQTTTEFARDTNYEDINIVASSGLNKDEEKQLLDTEGILDAEGTWQLVDSVMQKDDTRVNVEIDGLTERVAVPQILDGEVPRKADECALTDQTMKDYDIAIGDQITLQAGDDAPNDILKKEKYSVTARVLHPDCLYTGRSDVVFVSQKAFDSDVTDGNYTYIRIDADIPDSIRVLDEDYKKELHPIIKKLEKDLKPIGESHDKKLRDDAQKELDDTKADVNADLKDAKEKLDDARDELDAQEAQVEQMEQMGMVSSQARASLDSAQDELDEKQKEYDEQKADADKEIADAQKEIDDIKDSGYLLIPRTQIMGYIMLHENIAILRSLAVVFVIIFTGIGAIVVFSTITILIDGQRELIGTMKAVGFRNREIVSRYLLFGVLAVCFGMVLSVGLEVFLQIIMHRMLGPMFCVGPNRQAFNGSIFAILLVFEIIVASAVTVFVTVKKAVRTSAVDLMNKTSDQKIKQTKTAETAKGSLYSRLILRNMRTDLARVICSMVIIAGSALMIGVGFTLNGSLNNMMERSAEVVNHYDIEAARGTGCSDDDYKNLKKYLEEGGISFAEVEKKSTMFNAGDFDQNVTIITGKEDIFKDYIELASMKGQKMTLPEKDDILVCNRISENSDVNAGDRIELYDEDFARHEVKVSGICRNYYGSLMYLSQSSYKEIYGKKSKNNTLLIRVSEGQNRKAIAEDIQKEYPDFDLTYTDEMPEDYIGLTEMFTVLVIVMTGLSIMMSIFVLLNLVNIFVSRRKSELIIMRVIGFSYQQDIGYLLKETIVTTIVGIAGGVLMGCRMTDFLVRTVEGAETMFVRTISPSSWIIAVILEGIFALLINLFAFRRVKEMRLTDITE